MAIGNTIYYLALNNTINVNGLESNDLVCKFFSVVFPAAFAVAGYLLFKAKGYYPWYINLWQKNK